MEGGGVLGVLSAGTRACRRACSGAARHDIALPHRPQLTQQVVGLPPPPAAAPRVVVHARPLAPARLVLRG